MLLLLCLVVSGAQAGSPLQQVLTELASSMDAGKIVTDSKEIPGPYQHSFSQYVPGAMILPENGQDISLVLNSAHAHGVKVAVRSFAGHSYVGQSSVGSDGLLLNLRNMKGFRIDESSGEYTAIVGPGIPQLELYSRLAMHSPPLGLNGGTCPSVALSGLVSGGGEGMTSSYAGMTSDRLISAKAVVWTGTQYEEIDAPEDLMFALRGGMGGNYGVVTEWRMHAFPASWTLVFSYRLGPQDAQYAQIHDMSRHFMAFLRSRPDDSIWGMVKFMSGGNVKFVGQCLCRDGDCSACSANMKSMEGTILHGLKGGFEKQSFGESMWSWAGCTEWGGVDAYPPGGLQGISETDLMEAMQKCFQYDTSLDTGITLHKSLYMADEGKLDSSFEDTALSLVRDEAVCNQSGNKCYIQQSYVGGAMISPHVESAFVHRTAGSHVQIILTGSGGDSSVEWIQMARTRLLPLSIHESYQNYPDNDLELAEWSALYFGTGNVFSRLVEIKCKYNPTGVMDLPHANGGTIPTNC